MKKRILALLLIAVLAISLVGCGGGKTPANDTGKEANETEKTDDNEESADVSDIKVAMVTDAGGVHDQSFNQSAWEGLELAKEELGVKVSYVESKKAADFAPNFETLLDDENNLIWGVGFMLADALHEAAEANPDVNYAIVDFDFEGPGNEELFPEGTPDNVMGLVFKAEESSFLVGYIAGLMTETNQVGFIGGVPGEVIGGFDYGFQSGVQFAANELGKEIIVKSQYAEAFDDATKGKAIATNMYQQGADIIFHASGDTGNGVIEAAKEQDKWVIGVDMDQNHLAPEHVLTSAMKQVNQGVLDMVKDFVDGKFAGGTAKHLGLAEGAVGIAPSSDKNVPAEILEKVSDLEKRIVDGEFEVPFNEEGYEAFVKGF